MKIRPRAVRVRARNIARALAVVSMIFGGLGLLFWLLSFSWTLFAWSCALLAPWFLLEVAKSPRRVEVEARPGELVIGRSTVAVDEIMGAWVAKQDTLAVVRRDGKRWDLTLDAERPAEVLDAIGYDTRARTIHAALRPPIGAFTRSFIAFSFFMVLTMNTLGERFGAAGMLGSLLISLLATFLAKRAFEHHVVLGQDGVRVHRGPWQRFIAYRDIAQVFSHGASVTLELRSGKRVELPTVGQDDAQQRALVERIEAGRTASAVGTAASSHALERRGRSLDEWRDALSALAASEGGFRVEPLSRDALEREMNDVASAPERRVGAAIALRSLDDGAPRVRVAAETCADRDMRAALEAVSNDALDEETLGRVLRR